MISDDGDDDGDDDDDDDDDRDAYAGIIWDPFRAGWAFLGIHGHSGAHEGILTMPKMHLVGVTPVHLGAFSGQGPKAIKGAFRHRKCYHGMHLKNLVRRCAFDFGATPARLGKVHKCAVT